MKYILLFCFALVVTTNGFSQKLKNVTEKNGKIGIGTKQPDEMLTVKGKIHTQEVLVDLNGAVAPDYVFETYFTGTSQLNPTYTMPSLKEVSAYIETNHHLPGIPSAAEMTSEGLSLKAMNLILLQKIEELTLYTLQQQQELDNLKEKLSEIED